MLLYIGILAPWTFYNRDVEAWHVPCALLFGHGEAKLYRDAFKVKRISFVGT